MDITVEDIENSIENQDFWVEIPEDYTSTSLCDLANVFNRYQEIVTIGIDNYNQQQNKWTFSDTNDDEMEHDSDHDEDDDDKEDDNETKYKWINSLQVGDIINAKDYINNWYEAVIRYIDNKENKLLIYVHFIGWNTKFDAIYNCKKETDLQALSKRYSKCLTSHKSSKNENRQNNRLMLCWRTDSDHK